MSTLAPHTPLKPKKEGGGTWSTVVDGDSQPMLRRSGRGSFGLYCIEEMRGGKWMVTDNSIALQERCAFLLNSQDLENVLLPPKVPPQQLIGGHMEQQYMELRDAYDKLYAAAQVIDYQRAQMEARFEQQREEIKTLRGQLIAGFWEDGVPQFTQGEPTHEMTELVTAEQVNHMAQRLKQVMDEKEQLIIQRDALQRGSNPNKAENIFHDKTIRELQSSLPWTVHYHRDFRSSPMAHKDFGHGLLHILKAAGKLATVVNDAEHGGSEFKAEEVDRFVADMVVCALRMANTCPGRHIDLQHAVEARIEDVNSRPTQAKQ